MKSSFTSGKLLGTPPRSVSQGWGAGGLGWAAENLKEKNHHFYESWKQVETSFFLKKYQVPRTFWSIYPSLLFFLNLSSPAFPWTSAGSSVAAPWVATGPGWIKVGRPATSGRRAKDGTWSTTSVSGTRRGWKGTASWPQGRRDSGVFWGELSHREAHEIAGECFDGEGVSSVWVERDSKQMMGFNQPRIL